MHPDFLLRIAQIEAAYPGEFGAALKLPLSVFADKVIRLSNELSGVNPRSLHWSYDGYENIVEYYHMRRDHDDAQ